VVGKIEVFFRLVFVLGDAPSFHSRLWVCDDRFSPFISLLRLRRLFCLGRPRVLVFLRWRPAVVIVMGVCFIPVMADPIIWSLICSF